MNFFLLIVWKKFLLQFNFEVPLVSRQLRQLKEERSIHNSLRQSSWTRHCFLTHSLFGILGFRKSQAALGGETCTVPAVGSGAGASAQCTSTENGFCLIDQLTVTGANPVTGVNTAGKCVCYYGYSGPKCATKSTFSPIYVYNAGGLKDRWNVIYK